MTVTLPELPEPPSTEVLQGLDTDALASLAAELSALERETISAMSPYDRRLRELRARAGQIATEHRRRQRAVHIAARAAVREQARSGTLPTLADALDAQPSPFAENTPLQNLQANLATGGSVGLGYPNRPGQIVFNDGRQSRASATWGDARALWMGGWEPGAPGLPGVRVHLTGSRVERVVAADEIVLAGPLEAG